MSRRLGWQPAAVGFYLATVEASCRATTGKETQIQFSSWSMEIGRNSLVSLASFWRLYGIKVSSSAHFIVYSWVWSDTFRAFMILLRNTGVVLVRITAFTSKFTFEPIHSQSWECLTLSRSVVCGLETLCRGTYWRVAINSNHSTTDNLSRCHMTMRLMSWNR